MGSEWEMDLNFNGWANGFYNGNENSNYLGIKEEIKIETGKHFESNVIEYTTSKNVHCN